LFVRGRSAFRLFRPALYGGAALLRVLPHWCVEFLWRVVNGWASTLGVGVRWMLAKRMAASLGDNVFIGPDVEIGGWRTLSIGNNVSIHRFCYIEAAGGVDIGDHVSIAHSCSILSTNHRWANRELPIRDNPVTYEKVIIQPDVWLGCGVRVLAGVTLGRRVVVAAGGIVTRSAPDGIILGGVPARPIASTDEVPL
jgi:acetyltransferase-like isoleucine patch superfamily enzyme